MREMKPSSIFISHISEEAPIALALQAQLEAMFGPSVPVFVSSDKKSIQGGEEWFKSINSSLMTCTVLIALLSDVSATRVWIPYEVGVARGAGSRVLLLTVRDSVAAKLPYPFAGFQIWSILDMLSIVRELATALAVNPTVPELGAYRQAITEAEASVTYKKIRVEPVILSTPQGDFISFELQNIGNSDIDLISLELYVRSELRQRNTAGPSAVNSLWMESLLIKAVNYHKVTYTSSPNNVYESLPTTLTPSMGSRIIKTMRYPLKSDLSLSERTDMCRFQLHARNFATEAEPFSIGDLRRISLPVI